MIGQFQHGETVGCDSNNAGEKESAQVHLLLKVSVP